MKKKTIKFKYKYTPGEWREKPDGSLEYSREGVKPREVEIELPIMLADPTKFGNIKKSPVIIQMLKDCRELFPWVKGGEKS